MNTRNEMKEYHKGEMRVAKGLTRFGKRLKERPIFGLPLMKEEEEAAGKIFEEYGRNSLRLQKQQRWKTSAFWRFVRWLGGR